MNACRSCVDENEKVLETRTRSAGRSAVKLLRQKSATRTGTYRKGWTSSVKRDETGINCVVHNRLYQLTHLLNNGHGIKNQTGRSYGHVPGDHVIDEVAAEVSREFMGGA